MIEHYKLFLLMKFNKDINNALQCLPNEVNNNFEISFPVSAKTDSI